MKAKPESCALPPLPQGFAQSLAPLLKEEMQDFLQSYDKPWQRGIRKNPQKIPEGGLAPWVEGLLGVVPWEKNGLYITLESPAGMHPLHEAGAYYLQEPSAMAAVAALDPQPGEWVLDLCAAPGGKSSQIAARMQGRGLLVSNEPVATRAQMLSGNLERMGISHALVTCEIPEKLYHKWPGCFDRVLVDAPCSGEGMFRRHPEIRTEWTVQTPLGCARRQAEILKSGAGMVRDGGILCYSTCTFNTVENEGVIESFLKEHSEFSLVSFALSQDIKSVNGMLHLFPHRIAGEGHFVALMKKLGEGKTEHSVPNNVLPLNDKGSADAYHSFCTETFGITGPEIKGLFAGRLISAGALPDISGFKVYRVGLHLGEARGRHFVPDHAWAMSGLLPESCRKLPMTLAQAQAYLRGETLPAPEDSRGWAVMQFAGLALGWGKIAEGRVQNHYPKGLRKG
jgi:16S rRNA C967 or C1407 C5-methylase (RsmB/RsmF family)/NOL1/NOP2/fmu family ribosome biogenesis protein